MQHVGEVGRSISLSSAAADWCRYQKAKAFKSWLAQRHGIKESVDLPQIIAARRDASSLLRAMAEIEPGVFRAFEERVARNEVVDDRRLHMLQKAAVGVGGIDTGTWGSALTPFEQAQDAFIPTLAPLSSFDRMLADGALYRLQLRRRNAIATVAPVAAIVGEGQPKPLTVSAFREVRLPVIKAFTAVVLTDDVIRFATPGTDQRFQTELQQAIAKATDSAFLEIISEGTGVASNPSSGSTASAFMTDLAAALAAIETGAGSRLYLVLPLSVFNTVSLLRDGSPLVVNGKIGNITVIGSSAATTDGVLVDASSIGADSDLITTKMSDQATVELSDDPTTGFPNRLISLWQENLVEILAERYFGATVLRSNGVAVITGMAA
jgi:hypothetical protein